MTDVEFLIAVYAVSVTVLYEVKCRRLEGRIRHLERDYSPGTPATPEATP